ncbi:unnamed protein product [Amoebophrya sp. A120]|nr:unnamed protein product [Amoebophrya sp. A120]|eukprot:GSA120T00023617001.1
MLPLAAALAVFSATCPISSMAADLGKANKAGGATSAEKNIPTLGGTTGAAAPVAFYHDPELSSTSGAGGGSSTTTTSGHQVDSSVSTPYTPSLEAARFAAAFTTPGSGQGSNQQHLHHTMFHSGGSSSASSSSKDLPQRILPPQDATSQGFYQGAMDAALAGHPVIKPQSFSFVEHMMRTGGFFNSHIPQSSTQMTINIQVHLDELPDRDQLKELLREQWVKKHARVRSVAHPQTGVFTMLPEFEPEGAVLDWDYHLKGPIHLDQNENEEENMTVTDFVSLLYQGRYDKTGKTRVRGGLKMKNNIFRDPRGNAARKDSGLSFSDLASQNAELDPWQPLWQVWMLRGKPGAAFSARIDLLEPKYKRVNILIFRVHHALADGLRIALAGSSGFVTQPDGSPADFGKFIEEQKQKFLAKMAGKKVDNDPETTRPEVSSSSCSAGGPEGHRARNKTCSMSSFKLLNALTMDLRKLPGRLLNFAGSLGALAQHMFFLPKQTLTTFSGRKTSTDHMCEGLTKRKFLYFPTLDLDIVKLVKNILSRPEDPARVYWEPEQEDLIGNGSRHSTAKTSNKGAAKAGLRLRRPLSPRQLAELEMNRTSGGRQGTSGAAGSSPATGSGNTNTIAPGEATPAASPQHNAGQGASGARPSNLQSRTTGLPRMVSRTVRALSRSPEFLKRFFGNLLRKTYNKIAAARKAPNVISVNDVLQSCLYGAIARYMLETRQDPAVGGNGEDDGTGSGDDGSGSDWTMSSGENQKKLVLQRMKEQAAGVKKPVNNDDQEDHFTVSPSALLLPSSSSSSTDKNVVVGGAATAALPNIKPGKTSFVQKCLARLKSCAVSRKKTVKLHSATFMGFPDMSTSVPKGQGESTSSQSVSSFVDKENKKQNQLYNDWVTCLGASIPVWNTKQHRLYTPLERLTLTKQSGDWYKSHAYPFVLRWLLRNALWMLGPFANRQVLSHCFSRHSLLLSNVPGYNDGPINLLGKRVQAIYVPMPQILNYAMILTYNQKVFVTMAVNEITVTKSDTILKHFRAEFTELVHAAWEKTEDEAEREKLAAFLLAEESSTFAAEGEDLHEGGESCEDERDTFSAAGLASQMMGRGVSEDYEKL